MNIKNKYQPIKRNCVFPWKLFLNVVRKIPPLYSGPNVLKQYYYQLIKAGWPICAPLTWVIIGWAIGLLPVRHKTIIWTNADTIISWTGMKTLQWHFNWNTNIFIQENLHVCAPLTNAFAVSDIGLSPVRHQAIICTSADVLSIGRVGTNFSDS